MKKLFIIPAAILAVVFIVSAFRLNYLENATPNNIPQNATQSTQSQQPKYILKEYNGGIAVFTPDDDTPKTEYKEVMVKSLPEYDRMLLKSGIKVYSDTELQRLIEDYDS